MPELKLLDMYDNDICEIMLPDDFFLTKLEILNLGFNNLRVLPEEITFLKKLKVLNVANNFLTKIPRYVVDMPLKEIDVASNPLIQPPLEDCERGLAGMKRYYDCLQKEEQKNCSNLKTALRPRALKLCAGKAYRGKKGTLMCGLCLADVFRPTNINTDVVVPGTRILKKDTEDIPKLPENRRKDQSFIKSDVQQIDGYECDSKFKDIDKSKLQINIIKGDEHVKRGDPLSSKEEQFSEAERRIGSIVSDINSDDSNKYNDSQAVNDTLKVIFVGMANAGKTSIIKRLIEGDAAKLPKRDERTIGININGWAPFNVDGELFGIQGKEKNKRKESDHMDLKFSLWDFAGQNVYHATHQLFFSARSLYVLVWDMGANNDNIKKENSWIDEDDGSYKLTYDSDCSDDSLLVTTEEEESTAALEADIDEKVQFWVDCIQNTIPGAAILPVASFNDLFSGHGSLDTAEAKKRVKIMKQRLLNHEDNRKTGITERLNELHKSRQANTTYARKLQKLLSPHLRPKLIFDEENDCDGVLRVSSKENTGFSYLRQKLVNLANGHFFKGHVRAVIPKVRLDIRNIVRQKREDGMHLVEWSHFMQILEDNLHADNDIGSEDISDALHFLSNIGELSFFGGCEKTLSNLNKIGEYPSAEDDIDEDADAIRTISDNSSNQEAQNMLGNRDGLSQYIFLNPRWLVEAVATILTHNLRRDIEGARKRIRTEEKHCTNLTSPNISTFKKACPKVPVINLEELFLLWRGSKIIKYPAKKAEKKSNPNRNYLNTFDFLQRLLVQFSVLVPINPNIERVRLGGEEVNLPQEFNPVENGGFPDSKETNLFFLPCLLGSEKPAQFNYNCAEAYLICIKHSWYFPNGEPPGIMERITAAVLREIYAATENVEKSTPTVPSLNSQEISSAETYIPKSLFVHDIRCWKAAFIITLCMDVMHEESEEWKNSTVEISANLCSEDSESCVATCDMIKGTKRLVISGTGNEGDGGGINIWRGGYELVMKTVDRVMHEFSGLEFIKQAICPHCKQIKKAHTWDWSRILDYVKAQHPTIKCSRNHPVDLRLLSSACHQSSLERNWSSIDIHPGCNGFPIRTLFRGVVLVGLWDRDLRQIAYVGSGFVADKTRGLVVTAAHVLQNLSNPIHFGEMLVKNYIITVGVIPEESYNDQSDGDTIMKPTAMFRYSAEIVVDGGQFMDACILRLKTRFEEDVCDGNTIDELPETILPQDHKSCLKSEKLKQLKMSSKIEPDERIRIIGFNQGQEGLPVRFAHVNRVADFAHGAVIRMFNACDHVRREEETNRVLIPEKEIIVNCGTIGGFSGGPCVNLSGEVIGILSRADTAGNTQRCYLVPTSEFRKLLEKAVKKIKEPPVLNIVEYLEYLNRMDHSK